MRAVVKIVWSSSETPKLKLASKKGFEYVTLSEGRELDLELLNERRCTGYHQGEKQHVVCPDFRQIDSGDQCDECRAKDFYSEFRQGRSGKGLDSEYSVYIAQCGDEVKVGVTRGDRLERRWMEQGADYAAEIHEGLTADRALELESQLSSKGLKQRIRKENKLKTSEESISDKMEDLGIKAEVKKVSEPLRCADLRRKGMFPAPIKHVKGQILSDGRGCLAMTSGKCVVKAQQQRLGSF